MRFRQIHLDFHTSECVPDVGGKFDKKQFQEALKTGCVDSITLFSKCHHGWCYHPSKANVMHPKLKFDLLGAQLEACEELDVRTPIYISAGLDEKEAVRHPEWLARNADESLLFTRYFDAPGYHWLCFNTDYLDVLLAQIHEVAERYDPVEIFLDICAPKPCYCSRCRADMKKKGLDVTNPDDVKKQAEDVYANYARRVRETIDSVDKNIAVFHNFGHLHCGRRDLANTQTHLELESLPTGGWGYDDFPFSALYAETLGKEYLGMTGKFHKSWGEFGGFKHPNALRYEVSLSAALGAGSSVGDQLHPLGNMDMSTYKLIGAAYSELKEKEPWLKDTHAMSDVALLSSEAVGVAAGKNISRTADIGANRMLLEGKYLYSVIDTEEDFSKYKLLVMPDCGRVTSAVAAKLNNYLKNGGKLLASGTSCLAADKDEFAVDLGVKYLGENKFSPTYLNSRDRLKTNNGVLLMYGKNYRFETAGATEFAAVQNLYFNRTAEHFCSHAHAPNDPVDVGPGAALTKNTAYIGWEIFADYATKGALQCKELVVALIDQLIGNEKTLKTNLPDRGVVTLRRKGDALINHLLFAHTTVRGTNTEIIEDLLPICDTTVEIKPAKAPKSVTLQPQGIPVPFTYQNGVLLYTVDKFTCHQMIEIK